MTDLDLIDLGWTIVAFSFASCHLDFLQNFIFGRKFHCIKQLEFTKISFVTIVEHVRLSIGLK